MPAELVRMFFNRIGKLKALQCFKCKNLRFLSTEEAATKKEHAAPQRKYIKPVSTPELKPWTGNFIGNLCAGFFDKRMFEYPSVFQDENVDLVLDHCSEVDSFMRSNPDCLLTTDTLQKLKELELFGLSVPQKYGGAGYSETETKFLLECTGVNPVVARFLSHNENFACKLINYYGNEEQKEKYLPKIASGQSFVSIAFLEGDSLVDLSKQRGFCVYHEEDNHYVLFAEKKWVLNADKSDLFLVMVKSAAVEEGTIEVKFKIFIVEKNTPGVTVHKRLNTRETNAFEVVLDKVCLPPGNLLGSKETNGFDILKFGLAHSFTTDATLCLSIMKEIIYYAVQFIQEKNLNDTSAKSHGFIYENLSNLTLYTYALESAVYFLTGRFDSFKTPDLFNEAVLVKVIAIELFQDCIQRYIQILGRDALKSKIVGKAVEVLQYNSVFDENIEYLKLITASEGLVLAAPKLSKRVLIFRNQYDNYQQFFKETLKKLFKPENLKHNFKMEFHSSLSESADLLEKTCEFFDAGIEKLCISEGCLALENGHILINLAEMAAYIYASAASLSRANAGICYDLKNFESEFLAAQGFAYLSNIKVHELLLEKISYDRISECYRLIGKKTFNNKCYPAEHPLSRAF